DISDLFRHYQQQHEWKAEFPPNFFKRLQEYHWPGNIRELFNTFERLRVLFPEGGLIDPSQYSAVLDGLDWNSGAPSEEDRLTFRERVLKQTMMEALQKTKGNVSEAAKLAGIPRSTFYKRLRKYNL
ncbi:MAG: helix-turn-helix domain-containing protein, partial [Bacillota bacterium]|nr:helix-turn-helix domain-containing protein [Bacillota bacterium]